MRPIKFTEEQEQQMKVLYTSGRTQAQIAKLLNVSQSTVNRKLIKMGLNNNDSNRFSRININVEDLKTMYWDKQMHPCQISEIYGCSKQTIIKKMLQYNIPFRTKTQSRVGKLNHMYNKNHTTSSRRKMSDSFYSGKRVSMGFAGNWGKPSIYTDHNGSKVKMRSGWEVKTASYLSSLGVCWLYESIWIDLGESKYLPDFYLPDYNVFIEVKGRIKGPDIDKVRTANNIGHRVLLWTAEELLKRGIIDNSGNTELNRKYRNNMVFVDTWNFQKEEAHDYAIV